MATYRLHRNRSNSIYSVRDETRAIAFASKFTFKFDRLPLIGRIAKLSDGQSALLTRGVISKALQGYRPLVSVTNSKFPMWELLVKRIKEAL